MANITSIRDHVSLQPLAAALRTLKPPDQAPDPAGAWVATFTVYSLATRPWPQGTLTIERTPQADGFELKTHYTLSCGMGVQFHEIGDARCSSDDVATPVTWAATTRQCDAKGNETAGVSSDLTGVYGEGRVALSEYGKRRSLDVGPRLSWGWGLFEAVQRMALRPDPPPLRFTLLDHFDQIKEDHTLRLRKRCRLRLGAKLVVEETATQLEHGTVYRPERTEQGGTAVDCVVFEQTGRGILPIVYWCTADGRLLMVSSGLEAYVRGTEGD